MNFITIIVLWVVISFVGSAINKATRVKQAQQDAPKSKDKTFWEEILGELKEPDTASQVPGKSDLPPIPTHEGSFEPVIPVDHTFNKYVNSPLQEDQKTSSGTIARKPIRAHMNDKPLDSAYKIKSKYDLRRAVIWSEILKRKY